jgi:hypothetical protein
MQWAVEPGESSRCHPRTVHPTVANEEFEGAFHQKTPGTWHLHRSLVERAYTPPSHRRLTKLALGRRGIQRENRSRLATIAVTNARFVPLHGLPVAPSPSRPRPFHYAKRALVTSDIRRSGRMSDGLPSAARRAALRFSFVALYAALRLRSSSRFPTADRSQCSVMNP